MESINIAKIEELSETGKAVFCTYKGKRYRVVGIAKDMIGQLYRTGIVGNHPVFIQKGESAFFNVRADLISDINTTR